MINKFLKNFRYSVLMLIIGITFIFIGRIRVQHYIFLQKAIEICLQCTGIVRGNIH